jgi:hypothetical protein
VPSPAAADAVVVVEVAVAHLVQADLLPAGLLPQRPAQLRPVVLPRAAHPLLALAAVDEAADAVVVAQW